MFLYEAELKEQEPRYKELRKRLSEKCDDPKKLMDIVQAGIDDPELATNAIAEILEQLNH